MPAEGAIAQRARAQMPATWDALCRATEYGTPFLDQRVMFVKHALFATVVAQSLESDVYDVGILEYAGKVVALQVIPAGTDYWAAQLTYEHVQDETRQFGDRQGNLWKLHARLLLEVQDMQGTVIPKTLKRRSVPEVNTTGEYRSGDPQQFMKRVIVPSSSLPFFDPCPASLFGGDVVVSRWS